MSGMTKDDLPKTRDDWDDKGQLRTTRDDQG